MKRTMSTWLARLNPAKSKVAAITTAVGLAATLPGCLERPLGQDGPRTTNIIVDLLAQNVVDKVDMLFVIDNSMSMADKQAILAEAVPDLVSRFVKPVCLNAQNEEAAANANGDCPPGYGPEFTPINNIHIGVVTSSLGGFGSGSDCTPDGAHPYFVQKYDMAHLIGSLSEAADVPAASAVRRGNNVAAGGDFLTWNGGGQAEIDALSANFANQVKGAGEQGCGWEATMEAWVHFLVDPAPFTSIVRQACSASDTSNSCAGPAKGADGNALVDSVILQQRNAFLRMDSLLAVIMLTDENDCSFKLSGQQWLVSDTAASNTGTFKGSAQCAANPEDPCCQSCGKKLVAGCPADPAGATIATGCSPATYPLSIAGVRDGAEDQGNLRCFKQKQRFGADFLLPVERYSNALNELQICPGSETLTGCANPVPNPVFSREGEGTRPKTLVFFGGILGVPWQDLAVDPAAPVLEYKKAKADQPEELLNWDRLLGATPATGPRPLYPTLDGTIDPRMFESVAPRAGVPGPDSGFMADPANGHDWDIIDQSDLQYACIFPKPAVDCPLEADVREADAADPTTPIPNCDCTYYGPGLGDGGEYNSPLCQGANGQYSMNQAYGKAYPGVRELQALELFADANPTQNAIVASICPKEVSDKTKKDYGYRPAVATIVDRLKEQLQEPCLPRPLATKEDGGAACVIIEATTDATGCRIGEEFTRGPVDPAIAPLVYQALQTKELCSGNECQQYKLCEVPQIRPMDEGYLACISGAQGANGWCYLDQDKLPPGVDMEAVNSALAKCADTAKRKLRFAGDGAASTASSLTFFACSGSVYDVEM